MPQDWAAEKCHTKMSSHHRILGNSCHGNQYHKTQKDPDRNCKGEYCQPCFRPGEGRLTGIILNPLQLSTCECSSKELHCKVKQTKMSEGKMNGQAHFSCAQKAQRPKTLVRQKSFCESIHDDTQNNGYDLNGLKNIQISYVKEFSDEEKNVFQGAWLPHPAVYASMSYIDSDGENVVTPGERCVNQSEQTASQINAKHAAGYVSDNHSWGIHSTHEDKTFMTAGGEGFNCNANYHTQDDYYTLIMHNREVNSQTCSSGISNGVSSLEKNNEHETGIVQHSSKLVSTRGELIKPHGLTIMQNVDDRSNGALEKSQRHEAMKDTNLLMISSTKECKPQIDSTEADMPCTSHGYTTILHDHPVNGDSLDFADRMNYGEYDELTSNLCCGTDHSVDGDHAMFEDGVSLEVPCASEDSVSVSQNSGQCQAFLDFAGKYFNTHYKESGSNLTRRLKGKNYKKQERVSIEAMVCYNKTHVITAAHTPMYLPDNDAVACTLFRDICKYTRGSYKSDPHAVAVALQNIIGTALEKPELRDEIYCQLMRQSNENPQEESRLYAWNLLAVCTACFLPSVKLLKCLKHFIMLHSKDPLLTKHVEWCLRYISDVNRKPRRFPPSNGEITVLRSFAPLIVRVYFPDEKIKIINVHPTMTIGEMVKVVAEKIHVASSDGWALYELVDGELIYISEDEYVTDIVSSWERSPKRHQRSRSSSPSNSPIHRFVHGQSTSKPNSRRQSLASNVKVDTLLNKHKPSPIHIFKHANTDSPSNHGSPHSTNILKAALRSTGGNSGRDTSQSRFLFRRRFIVESDVADPVTRQLLYHQAVHSMTQEDDCDISLDTAKQLAGLQAQVMWGPYDPGEDLRYADVGEKFICYRILHAMDEQDVSRNLSSYHQQHGKQLTSDAAMLKYLNICLQIPLFGCVFFQATNLSKSSDHKYLKLAIHTSGIKLIYPIESTDVFCSYNYYDIENIMTPCPWNNKQIVIEVRNHMEGVKVRFLELTNEKQFFTAMNNHAPGLLTCFNASTKAPRNVDLFQLRDDIDDCQVELICAGLLQRPPATGSGKFLKTAFRRINRQVLRVDRSQSNSVEAAVKAFGSSSWEYTKGPLTQSLVAFKTSEEEEQVLKILNATIFLTSFASPLKNCEHVVDIQLLLGSCLDNKYLCNEFFLQLIRQTTHHPEPQSESSLYYWRLLVLLCCTAVPPHSQVVNYLQLHLKQAEHGATDHSELVEVVRFCSKCLARTEKTGSRHHAPFTDEIIALWSRKLITTKIWFADNSWCFVQFDSAATVDEIIVLVKAKMGLKSDATGFHLVEIFDSEEQTLIHNERLADSLYKWEKMGEDVVNMDTAKFVFKKRLFFHPYINPCDPVECELLRHQLIQDVYSQKIPVDIESALHLCALTAQADHGRHGQTDLDYSALIRILPPYIRDDISVEQIEKLHKDLTEVDVHLANLAFIDVLKKWQLFGATYFTVNQSQSTSLPDTLWMAINQIGLHLLPCKGKDILCSIDLKSMAGFIPSEEDITIKVKGKKEKIIVFNTLQGGEIALLIEDYMEAYLNNSSSSLSNSANGSDKF